MIASLSRSRSLRHTVLVIAVGLLAGCASTGGDTRDPWEGFNRGVYQFNQGADKVVFNPLGRGYNAVTPEVVDRGVTNFFSNLGEISNFVNNVLQLKVDGAANTVVRFMINTTLGIGGFFDVAGDSGVPQESEDFGQTLAYWGVDSGPYLVLPILGPSTVRDTGGRAADSFLNPVMYVESDAAQYGLVALGVVDTKSDLLGTTDLVKDAALDEYDFVKNAYFERRRSQINEDTDPREDEESYEDFLKGES